MICTRTVLLTAFFCFAPALPASAAPADHRDTAIAPCDASPLDGYYDPVAFRPDHSYFPDDDEGLPDSDEQAVPGGDENDDSTADGEGEAGEDSAPDGEGCAEITVAPYDFMVRPPEASPMPVLQRRRLRSTPNTRS